MQIGTYKNSEDDGTVNNLDRYSAFFLSMLWFISLFRPEWNLSGRWIKLITLILKLGNINKIDHKYSQPWCPYPIENIAFTWNLGTILGLHHIITVSFIMNEPPIITEWESFLNKIIVNAFWGKIIICVSVQGTMTESTHYFRLSFW